MNASLLHAVANPNCAVVLLLAGILLLYAEFNRPGTIVLGCVGALFILLAFEGLLHVAVRPSCLYEIGLSLAILAIGVWFPFRGATPAVACSILASGLIQLSVFPVLAILTAVIFCGVTHWLGRVALRARLNKTIYTRFEPYPSIPPVKPSIPSAG